MPTSKTRKKRRAAGRPAAARAESAPRPAEERPKAPRGRPAAGSGDGTELAEPWARGSLCAMLGIVGLLQLPIGTAYYLADRSQDLFERVILVPSGNPPLLLASCFVAMPLARRITGERRSMGRVETLAVGLTLFLVFLSFAATLVGAAGGTSNSTSSAPSPSSSTPLPTPVPATLPSASPVATVSPAPAPSARPRAASPAPSRTARLSASQLTVLAFVNVASLAATTYIFPMVYRLFWRRGRGGGRSRREAPDGGGRGRQ